MIIEHWQAHTRPDCHKGQATMQLPNNYFNVQNQIQNRRSQSCGSARSRLLRHCCSCSPKKKKEEKYKPFTDNVKACDDTNLTSDGETAKNSKISTSMVYDAATVDFQWQYNIKFEFRPIVVVANRPMSERDREKESSHGGKYSIHCGITCRGPTVHSNISEHVWCIHVLSRDACERAGDLHSVCAFKLWNCGICILRSRSTFAWSCMSEHQPKHAFLFGNLSPEPFWSCDH